MIKNIWKNSERPKSVIEPIRYYTQFKEKEPDTGRRFSKFFIHSSLAFKAYNIVKTGYGI